MLALQDVPFIYVTRNLLRKVGVEMVPAQADSSLLAMHLSLLFSELGISRVLDVGARYGDYGTWLRRNGYRGDIISFEPIKDNFKQLERAAANDSNWYCLNYALGAEDSVASINVSKDTQFSSFHQPSSVGTTLFGGSLELQHVEEVEVRQLDNVLDALPAKLDNRTYLKLDTQGWDLEVLKGAHHALTYVAALQAEVAVQRIYDEMPPMHDSLSAITSHGFTPSGFFPVTLDSKMALIEYDLVAVRSATISDPR